MGSHRENADAGRGSGSMATPDERKVPSRPNRTKSRESVQKVSKKVSTGRERRQKENQLKILPKESLDKKHHRRTYCSESENHNKEDKADKLSASGVKPDKMKTSVTFF